MGKMNTLAQHQTNFKLKAKLSLVETFAFSFSMVKNSTIQTSGTGCVTGLEQIDCSGARVKCTHLPTTNCYLLAQKLTPHEMWYNHP